MEIDYGMKVVQFIFSFGKSQVSVYITWAGYTETTLLSLPHEAHRGRNTETRESNQRISRID